MNLRDQNNPAVLNAIKEIVQKNREEAVQEEQKNAAVAASRYANFKPKQDVQEALVGKQHKIDKNKNGKIDAHDFKLLKKEETEVEEVEQIDEISLQTMKSAREKLGNKALDAHYDDNKYAARHYANRALSMSAKIKKKEKVQQQSEEKDTPGNSYTHQCALHVKHAKLGEGKTIYSQHAEPDEAGQIAWYDVMFSEGIHKQVPIEELEVLVSESHGNHKKK